ASLERGSEHPLASAIVDGAREKGVGVSAMEGFQSRAGMGVTGRVDRKTIAVGNSLFFAKEGTDLTPLSNQAEGLRKEGQTVMFLSVDGRLAGFLGVADPIKETAAEALGELQRCGVRVVMLTGDNRATALSVARRLYISDVEAEVLPEQKGEVVGKFRESGRIVAMAGDGVNDAPALARAHVGIALSSGTDVAIQSADVVLTKGDLRGIVRVLRLSRAVLRNIRQNLFFAFVYNVLGVGVAAGALYPFFGILLSPMVASAAMSFSSVSVIANALRLRKTVL
ncbi:MAG: HAD-IC family P-type ATPase, partial [Elusimicrobia bacterium]|nr:HAD-IC family P-type ATPase [Elusimicrobiota bacterium]